MHTRFDVSGKLLTLSFDLLKYPDSDGHWALAVPRLTIGLDAQLLSCSV